jgi:hypothetical protein
MQNKTVCPNEETLTDFLEHRLADKARKQVEHHLAGCALCRDQVAVYADLLDKVAAEEAMSVPRTVTQKAVDAVLGLDNSTWLDNLSQKSRRAGAKVAAVLERLTWRPVPDAVAVRGNADTRFAEVIHLEKQFEDLRVTIDIEKSDVDQAIIRVCGFSSQQNAAPVRVTLLSPNREMASAVLVDTPVLFEEIPMGTYTLVFVRQNIPLGQYAFEMTGNV